MRVDELKEKYPEVMFKADEYVQLKEINRLVQRLVDIEMEVENIKNEMHTK